MKHFLALLPQIKNSLKISCSYLLLHAQVKKILNLIFKIEAKRREGEKKIEKLFLFHFIILRKYLKLYELFLVRNLSNEEGWNLKVFFLFSGEQEKGVELNKMNHMHGHTSSSLQNKKNLFFIFFGVCLTIKEFE